MISSSVCFERGMARPYYLRFEQKLDFNTSTILNDVISQPEVP